MHRMLIVDDERHIVDWLSELFMEYNHLELELYTAYSGSQALEVLGRMKIDIVLSDIKMPGLGGIELAERIWENWPTARIIFLTGYNNFDYVYMANKHKNTKFLLKTEDDDVILKTVEDVVRELEDESHNIHIRQYSISLEQLVEYQMQREIVVNALERPMETDKTELYKTIKGKIPRFNQKVILTTIRGQSAEAEDPLTRNKFLVNLNRLLRLFLNEKGVGFALDYGAGKYLWIVQPTECKELQYNAMILRIKESIGDIAQFCHDELNFNPFLLLYLQPIFFNQIKEKQDFLFTSGEESRIDEQIYGGRLLGEQDEREYRERNQGIIRDLEMRKHFALLEMALEKENKGQFFKELDWFLRTMEHIQSQHFFPAIEAYQFIATLYLAQVNRHQLYDKVSFEIGLNRLFSLQDFAGWHEAFTYLVQFGEALFKLKSLAQSDKSHSFVETVKYYIDEHISDDLSLTTIANSLSYNPSYVSRLFKQLSGVNLLEYINSTRLKYAQHLLEHTSLAAQEVAAKAGFVTSQYFSTVFRKHFGMSPQEYRHQNENR